MTLTTASIVVFGGSNFGVTAGQWLANVAIWAPALGQPYVDGAYWSLVIEVIFYAWFAIFLTAGMIPKRIDVIVVTWLGITFANELTIDATILEKVCITDDSGFFAVGLLFYEYFRGRRNPKLYALLVLAIGTSIFQAVHKIEKLGVHTGGNFDPKVAALICAVSIVVVFWAIGLRRVFLPKWLVLAVGGITYPLYLLHMQLGYVFLLAIAPVQYIEAWTAIIVLGVTILSWLIWHFAEYPLHVWTKMKMTQLAVSFGLTSRVAVPSIVGTPVTR
jgi:peptidoglycan/LPS O-acetylase OafA/YrhL